MFPILVGCYIKNIILKINFLKRIKINDFDICTIHASAYIETSQGVGV